MTLELQELLTILSTTDPATITAGEDPQLAPVQHLLKPLVQMTLTRTGRDHLQDVVDAGSSPDERKAQIINELGICPDDVQEIAPLFCDRLFAGVAQWPAEDREKWID